MHSGTPGRVDARRLRHPGALLSLVFAAAATLALVVSPALGAPHARAEVGHQPDKPPGSLTGSIPAPGAFGLVAWSGGDTTALGAATSAAGCELRSVWATKPGGGLVGYIEGAPAFVNADFFAIYPDASFEGLTPLIVVCAGPELTSKPPRTSTDGSGSEGTESEGAGSEGTGSEGTESPDEQPDAGLSSDEALMLELVNGARVAAGVPELVVDAELLAVARAHSRDMAERDFFAHTNPDGLDPFERMDAAGISFGWAGENIAMAQTTTRAHQLLMDSPGHLANILKAEYRHVGIGVYTGDGSLFFTQLFTD